MLLKKKINLKLSKNKIIKNNNPNLDLYSGDFGKYIKGMYIKQPDRQFIDFVDYEPETTKLPLSDFLLFLSYLLYNPHFIM